MQLNCTLEIPLFIQKSKAYKSIELKTKQLSLPGFYGINIYDVLQTFTLGIAESSITIRAAAMAFKFMMALFPAIIFLFTLIAFVPIEDLHDDIFHYLSQVLPADTYSTAKETIQDLLKNKHSGLLSFGFLITLYVGSDGVYAMMESFDHSFHTTIKRPALKQRLISILLMFVLTFLLLATGVLIIFGEIIVSYIQQTGIIHDSITINLLILVKWVAMLCIILFSTSIIYYLGPVKTFKFGIVNPGSVFATISVIVTSLGFAFYINNFGTYNKLYGSIGTFLVVMLWLYFNSIMLLLGFELNATITTLKQKLKH